MAEGMGFEPMAPYGVTGFQDQLLKPLGHPSILKTVQFLSALTDTVSHRSIFNAIVSIHCQGDVTLSRPAYLGLTDPTEHLLLKRHWNRITDSNR